MRLIACLAALLLVAAPAAAQDSARTLVRGEAASSLVDDLSAALRRSGAQLEAPDAAALRTALREDLAPLTNISRDAQWSADLDIEWRPDASPPNDRRGACGGYVDIGRARVTATSTARASSRGLARMVCSVTSQTEHDYGWTGFGAVTAGEGALIVRFTITSGDAALRQMVVPSLARALERVLANVAPTGAEGAAPRPLPPRSPRQPQAPTQPPPDIDDSI